MTRNFFFVYDMEYAMERLEISNYSIFKGKNFNNWKFRMLMLLKEQGLEEFLDKSVAEHDELIEVETDSAKVKEEKSEKKKALEKNERKCHRLLIERISDNYLEHVKDDVCPKGVWKSMRDIFERKGVSSRMFLRRKLLTFKMKNDDELEEHILEFDKILRELKASGGKMEVEDTICQLLFSLPKRFEQISTALELIPPDKLTMDFVKASLLDADIKQKYTDAYEEQPRSQTTPSAFSATSKKDIICFNCGKKGHYKNECKSECKNQSHFCQLNSLDSEDEIPIQF